MSTAVAVPLYDLTPLVRIMLTGVLWASGPLAWVYLRRRHAKTVGRVRALTLVTLFLTFDLVLFGAFTRLTDSGLGCPDWPGCYGQASPIGAQGAIAAAQEAMPTGPVTHGKAWIEMVHRYLATGVGALILVLTVLGWKRTRVATDASRSANLHAREPSPWLPTLTLLWVCVQGAFGALTVTMKLFPAIVTLHLLGGLILLALLSIQVVQQRWADQGTTSVVLAGSERNWLWVALVCLTLQVSSGAWVSTNYAVLACAEFPMCQGQWWPLMDVIQALEIWRPLGLRADGSAITFQALTAIHMLHRLMALVTVAVLLLVVVRLWKTAAVRPFARTIAAVLVLQLATGISNVVLDWPLLAAVLHTGGAAALVMALVSLLADTRSAPVLTDPIRSAAA